MPELIDSTKNSGIYIIRNTVSGKVYIGSAVNIKGRWRNHRYNCLNGKHCNIHLQRAWNKYGADAFEFKVIFYCKPVDLIHYEQLRIDEYREKLGWDTLYNISPTAGSSFGVKHTPEDCAKKSARQKGIKRSPETRAKISAAQKGRKLSPERCAKMSAISKGKKHSPETRAKMSAAHKGKKLSSEHCAKLRDRKHSPETKAKLSALNKGRKHTPETRAKISAAMKGNTPCNKGKKVWSLEARAEMSARMKGNIPWNKGRKLSPEGCEKT